ncbi:hypothetical protein ABZ569_32320 [Streptomyces albus]|uniref:hypothetical protein n=1 Tax=Streptomyces albus TaxID=1888 RepID=UPI0033FFFDA8
MTIDTFLAAARSLTTLFLARLDELHPALIAPVLLLMVVIVGAAAFAIAFVAAAAVAISAAAGIGLLARRVIVAAVAYSHARREVTA